MKLKRIDHTHIYTMNEGRVFGIELSGKRHWFPKYLAVAFTTFLFIGAILGNTPTIEAKSKKATVTVTVENFKPNEKKLEYKVYKTGTHKLVGKKELAANKVETDEPDFSLNIKYNGKGCMKGVELIFVFTG